MQDGKLALRTTKRSRVEPAGLFVDVRQLAGVHGCIVATVQHRFIRSFRLGSCLLLVPLQYQDYNRADRSERACGRLCEFWE